MLRLDVSNILIGDTVADSSPVWAGKATRPYPQLTLTIHRLVPPGNPPVSMWSPTGEPIATDIRLHRHGYCGHPPGDFNSDRVVDVE